MQAYQYLNKQGHLFLEIGYDQKEEVVALLEQTNQYCQIEVKQDLAGKDRVVIAKVR